MCFHEQILVGVPAHKRCTGILGGSYVADRVDPLIEKSEGQFDPAERSKTIGDIILKQYQNATWLYLYEPVTVVLATDKVDWKFYDNSYALAEYWNIRLKA